MSSQNPRQIIHLNVAALARAIGHEHRLGLLEHLGQGEWPVEILAEKTGLSFANASQHLHLLRQSGLVVSRKAGKNVFYRLADGPVLQAISALRQLAESNVAEVAAIVGAYFSSQNELEPATFEELKARMHDSNLLILDVREESEYRQGHLPSAIHLPFDQLEESLHHLPKGKEIIAYCRGPYCILSFETVRLLRANGISCRRMQDGFPEWKAAGGEIASEAH